MAEPYSSEARSPLPWWVRLCHWLWTRLLWIWGAIILGVGINVGSTWLISPTLNVTHTPLGWLLLHLLITISFGVGLLVLTAITGIVTAVHHRSSPHHPSMTLAQQNRERFLTKLQSRYNDILEQSLQGAVQATLGFSRTPDAVINTTRLRFHQKTQPEQELPAGTSILQVYDLAGGELLILGEPGAGKTTQLLNLAMALRDRSARDEHHPLPVVVNLSTWANSHRPLQEWLVGEVATSYDVPHLPIAQWIRVGQILPLLDGLDEVPLSARAACVEAINAFRQEQLVPLVVCSRSEEYFRQQSRLILYTAVVMQPLSAGQVDAYFKQAGSSLAGVRSMLRKNAELRELVRTPLMLHLVTLAYHGVSARSLSRRGSVEEQQRKVLDQYVQRMLFEQGPPSPTSTEQMKHSLTWLAQQMQQRNQTVFYLEHLQPDWLPVAQFRQLYKVLALRIPGILVGLLISLLVTTTFFASSFPDIIWWGLIGGVIGGLLSGSYPSSFLFPYRGRALKNKWRHYLPVGLGYGGLLGVVTGVSFALWGDPFLGTGGLQGGLIYGICAGLSGLLLCVLISAGKMPVLEAEMPSKKRSGWWHRLVKTDHVRLGILVSLLIGLSAVLSYGLSVALNDAQRFIGYLGECEGFRYGQQRVGWNAGLRLGLQFGLSYGLSIWLSFGIIGTLLGFLLLRRKNTIEPTERIVWSARHLWRSLIQRNHLHNSLRVFIFTSLLIGLNAAVSILGFPVVMYNSNYNGPILDPSLIEGISTGLGVGLSVGLVYWILLGLWNGIPHETLDNSLRIIPNQGIRRSARNSLLIGLIAGGLCAFFGLLNAVLTNVLYFGLNDLFTGKSDWLGNGLGLGLDLALSWGAPIPTGGTAGPPSVLMCGVAGSLVAGLLTGGWACLQHLTLRVLLRCADVFPWHAVRFLDDASRRILLIKDGGGYRFVHRLFLDYFASLEMPLLPNLSIA